MPPDGQHLETVIDFLGRRPVRGDAEHDGSEALVRAAVVDACYASAAQRTEVALGRLT